MSAVADLKMDENVREYLRKLAGKGGRGRAKVLSAKRRRQIARKGARARWKGSRR